MALARRLARFLWTKSPPVPGIQLVYQSCSVLENTATSFLAAFALSAILSPPLKVCSSVRSFFEFPYCEDCKQNDRVELH